MSPYEERKRLEQEDGEPLHTLRLTPEPESAARCNGAGILVVAGEWGMTVEIEERIVRPLAELGYFVVAIDLVRGETAADETAAARRRDAIDPELAIDDLASALLYLKEMAGGRLGVLGLDAAMPLVIEAATRLPQIDAVVVAGGGAPRKGVKLSRVRGSIMVHRGTPGLLTDEQLVELTKRIEPARQVFLVHGYDAPDRFFARPLDDEERGLAAEAFDRTCDFFAQTLI